MHFFIDFLYMSYNIYNKMKCLLHVRVFQIKRWLCISECDVGDCLQCLDGSGKCKECMEGFHKTMDGHCEGKKPVNAMGGKIVQNRWYSMVWTKN